MSLKFGSMKFLTSVKIVHHVC